MTPEELERLKALLAEAAKHVPRSLLRWDVIAWLEAWALAVMIGLGGALLVLAPGPAPIPPQPQPGPIVPDPPSPPPPQPRPRPDWLPDLGASPDSPCVGLVWYQGGRHVAVLRDGRTAPIPQLDEPAAAPSAQR